MKNPTCNSRNWKLPSNHQAAITSVQFGSVKNVTVLLYIFCSILFFSCSSEGPVGTWDYELDFDDDREFGVIKINRYGSSYQVNILTSDLDKIELQNVVLNDGKLAGDFEAFSEKLHLTGFF